MMPMCKQAALMIKLFECILISTNSMIKLSELTLVSIASMTGITVNQNLSGYIH